METPTKIKRQTKNDSQTTAAPEPVKPRKPGRPKATPAATPTSTAAKTRGPRAYPRGSSPFCSPAVGDVLLANSGHYREVASVGDGGKIRYTSLPSGKTELEYGVCGRGAWASWCSRTEAIVVTRGSSGCLAAEAQARQAITG